MNTTAKGMLKALAARSVIAAIPVAMVTAYASNLFVPTPPRLAEYSVQPVAEITNSGSTIGIAASALSGQTAAQIGAQLDEMLSIGVTNVRLLVPWYNLEYNGPIDQASPMWQLVDNVMTEAAKRNMGVLANITSTPDYAVTVPGLFPGTGTPSAAALATFMQKFIARTVNVNGVTTSYGSIVSAYEIWNEPNSAQFSWNIDPVAYANLLKTVYPVIKAADSTATVVAGAVGAGQTSLFTLSPVTFVTAMLAAGAGPYFDALSVHPYSQIIPITGTCPTCAPGILTPQQQLDALKLLIGGKKIWITEYGLPTYDAPANASGNPPPITEAQQAAWIKDLLEYWAANPSQAGPIFLYTGRDATDAIPTVDEGNFGLFKFDVATQKWVPKTAAEMLEAWLNPPVVVPPVVVPPVVVIPPGPVGMGNPVAGLAQVVQAFFQQITQVIQNIANFGPQLINTIVSAIQNLFRPLAAPVASTLAAPLAMRVASVDPTVDTSEEPSFARVASTPDAGAAAKTGAVDLDEVDEGVVAPKDSGPDTNVVTSTLDPVIEAAPVEATPVVVTTPEVTVPEVTTPAVTTPVAAAATNSATSTPAADRGEADGSTKPGDATDGKGAAGKSNADKSGSDKRGGDHGDADKDKKDGKDADKQGPSNRHANGKGANGFGAPDAAPKAAPEAAKDGAPAANGATTAASVSAG